MRVMVVGGGGTLGRLVVTELERRGHDVAATSRAAGVDPVTGAGLRDAVRGADAVVDCTNVQTASGRKAVAVFGAIAGELAGAVRAERVPHLVAVTIFGVHGERMRRRNGYYRGKAEQERILAASGAPVTLVRSTQWFELAETFLKGRIGQVAIVPHMRSQPVAAAEVARTIADTVDAGPRPGSGAGAGSGGGPGSVPESGPEARSGAGAGAGPGPGAAREVRVAGPEVRDIADLSRAIARRRGAPRFVVAFRIPGVDPLFEAGELLPAPDVPTAGPRFEEWLTTR